MLGTKAKALEFEASLVKKVADAHGDVNGKVSIFDVYRLTCKNKIMQHTTTFIIRSNFIIFPGDKSSKRKRNPSQKVRENVLEQGKLKKSIRM